MNALTLTQPFASLCVFRNLAAPLGADAVKPFETRSWFIRPERLPMRIAIHAAKGISAADRRGLTMESGLGRRKFREPYGSALASAGLSRWDPWYHQNPIDGVPIGAIVGLATILEVLPADEVTRRWQRGEVSDRAYSLGLFTPGRYAWRLGHAVSLEHPVPCSGMQGLWKVPGPVVCEIEDQLSVAAYNRGEAPLERGVLR